MLKKSRLIALLLVCVMMFTVVESACARTWGEFFTETTVGGVAGALLGTAAIFFTGGAALPLVIGGAAIGSVIGATPEEYRTKVVVSSIAPAVIGKATSAILNQIPEAQK